MSDQPSPLNTDQLATVIGATPAILATIATTQPEGVLRRRPDADEWSVLDTIGHLIEAEQRGFAGRIRRFLAEDDHQCEPWDPPAVARARRDHEREPAALLSEFADLRAASVVMIGGLQPVDLARTGRHPQVGRLTVSDLLNEWVHHDQEHLRQIHALIQGAVWPFMGNAQRFSRPSARALVNSGEN